MTFNHDHSTFFLNTIQKKSERFKFKKIIVDNFDNLVQHYQKHEKIDKNLRNVTIKREFRFKFRAFLNKNKNSIVIKNKNMIIDKNKNKTKTWKFIFQLKNDIDNDNVKMIWISRNMNDFSIYDQHDFDNVMNLQIVVAYRFQILFDEFKLNFMKINDLRFKKIELIVKCVFLEHLNEIANKNFENLRIVFNKLKNYARITRANNKTLRKKKSSQKTLR